MARKKTKKASEMFPLVAEFKRSGMTQQAFSEKKQIAYGMFLYWLKKYNDSADLGRRGIMRLAVLSDIHGNLPALERALALLDAGF